MKADDNHRDQALYQVRSCSSPGHTIYPDAAKRYFRKMLPDPPLLALNWFGMDGAGTYTPSIAAAKSGGLLPHTTVHYVTKHLQQGIERDCLLVKKPMPSVGGFRSFNTARRSICSFEAMLWLRERFSFVCE